MDRRRFIQLGSFVTVSTATLGLAGCGSDNNSSSGTASANLPPQATGSQWKFPQGVASGDPKSDSILLWTRLVPSTADNVTSSTHADTSLMLMVTASDNAGSVGTDTALTGTMVVNDAVPTYASYDHTARHKVQGLAAGTTYYYQFVAGTARSMVGRFKTAPAATDSTAQLKFAVLTCQDWSTNHWGVYTDLVSQDLDFYLHLGDYIYETTKADFQNVPVETLHDALALPDGTAFSADSPAKYATTINDYRYLYKKYRTDSRIQAVHARFAMIAIWDDHEFSDDCWMDSETYSNGTAVSNNHQPARRRGANQAWFEFMPADIQLDNSAAAGFNNVKIYRDFQFGTLAHLIMTDERLYRTDHLIAEGTINPATGQPVGRIGSRYMASIDNLDKLTAFKVALAQSVTPEDPLRQVSMLGMDQRNWWKKTVKSSPATWKLWGNEVSLLRMGLNGTNAIATLIALQAFSTIASGIQTAAASTGGNIPVAATIVAGATMGATQAIAAAAAQKIAVAAATGQDKQAAAVSGGLTAAQATVAVATFTTVANAAAAGAPAATQVMAGAQYLTFGVIKTDIMTNKGSSAFIPTEKKAALAPFFGKFAVNADQWDGYNAERKDLMAYLKANAVSNVVALTGDIHAFFAGTVMDDFDAAAPAPVMVDLVTAGVSSDSFFNYLKDAVGSVSADLGTLVYYPLSIPVNASTTLSVNVNLLDYTLGKAAPTAATLANSLKVQIRTALAAKGIPEAALDMYTTQIVAGLQANPDFTGKLVPLAQQLASLNSNPWLKLVNTDAQGYALVTLTSAALNCEFRQVNRLVASAAPATSLIAATATATVTAGQPAVTVTGMS